jgi:hypothetical protein
MFNPLSGLESFLDSNIESGNIWYYIIGFILLGLYLLWKY